MSRICVVGSANVDFVVAVERLPQPGETVSGDDLMTAYGGKGANQAVAAARVGGQVTLLARFGDDAFGGSYRQYLIGEGLELPLVEPVASTPTGCALILVDSGGGNVIAVSPGANRHLGAADLERCATHVRAAGLVVAQVEVPVATVVRAIGLANEAGVPVMLNPSPVPTDFPWDSLDIDYLVINETEAERILGQAIEDADSLRTACRSRLPRVRAVVVTRGADPTLAADAQGVYEVPAFAVTPVDTVGAGDAFTGGLAVATVEGKGLAEAIRFANGAGALAATRRGAQPSLPTREEVEALLKSA